MSSYPPASHRGHRELPAPAQVSSAATATGPNLHCQAQFSETRTARPVVRVSAHRRRAYITRRRRQLLFGRRRRGSARGGGHFSLSLPLTRLRLSSSGVNTLSGSLPKSHSAHHSDLDVTRTPLSVDHSPDSGLVSTPVSIKQCGRDH